MKPVEFSNFFKILFALRDGVDSEINDLETLLEKFKSGEESDSALHQLGQSFCYVGLSELYKYSGTENIKEIALIEKSRWDELQKENGATLPIYLANAMISFSREQKLVKSISQKWGISNREVQKHVTGMARYVTEGIIEVID